MHTGTLSVKDIFGQERRYIVPLFQRPYVWTREAQWEPLWEDLRTVSERAVQNLLVRAHFLGAIVVDQLRRPTGHVESRLVIDGQQRLTTLQLVLEAFADFCAVMKTDSYHRALLKLTRNDDPLSKDPDEEFKVWPTNVDREHFRRTLRIGSPTELRKTYGVGVGVDALGHSIPDAYLFFYDAIAGWVQPGTDGDTARVGALYDAVRNQVRMVVIDLSDEDDAQLIFETLNARGTPLLPSDLVKNFLFHEAQLRGLDIDPLYEKHWRPFDEDDGYWRAELGRGHARRARIDTYLQHYLTLRTGDDVPAAHLYAAYRDHARDGEEGPTEQLDQLSRYGRIFRGFDEMDQGSREGLFFSRLREMDTTTAYPFLMDVFARHADDSQTVITILEYLESFLVRRMVCQLSTRGYNRFFTDLLRELREKADSAPQRVRAFLLSQTAEANRWPLDEEFRRAWIEIPVYRVLARGRVRMLLEALERELRTGKSEKIAIQEKLTVEHLLPQAWQEHWSIPGAIPGAEAADERELRLHTIGNLTLVTRKLNPSLSNGPWKTKREAIQENSALALNRELWKREAWDEATIRERGQMLFALARKTWPIPDTG